MDHALQSECHLRDKQEVIYDLGRGEQKWNRIPGPPIPLGSHQLFAISEGYLGLVHDNERSGGYLTTRRRQRTAPR